MASNLEEEGWSTGRQEFEQKSSAKSMRSAKIFQTLEATRVAVGREADFSVKQTSAARHT